MGRFAAVRRQRLPVQRGRLPGQERISVGVLENHQFLRDRLTEFLNHQADLQVVVSAAATPGGLERLKDVRPQVVVIGSSADGTACPTCVRNVKQALPEARVVVMNVSVKREDVILLIEAGASGLLLQEATLAEFVHTLRLVSGGTNVVPERVVPLLFAHLAASHPGKQAGAGGGGGRLDRLTHREREVSDLITEGLRNQAVADSLAISLHTVKTHVHNILAKLGLQSRLQIPEYVHKHRR